MARSRQEAGRAVIFIALLRTLREVRLSIAAGRPMPLHQARRLYLRSHADCELADGSPDPAPGLQMLQQWYRRHAPWTPRLRLHAS